MLDADCQCAGISTTPNVLDVQIAAGNDDAEEGLAAGNVSLNSSDLELIYDAGNGGDQVVGIRFGNIDLPPGAVIEKAYVQFTADKAC
jgi:hypothetical protein